MIILTFLITVAAVRLCLTRPTAFSLSDRHIEHAVAPQIGGLQDGQRSRQLAYVGTLWMSNIGIEPIPTRTIEFHFESSTASSTSGLQGTSTDGVDDGIGARYMKTVSYWRNEFGLPPLRRRRYLEANAFETGMDSGGLLIHKLNPGTLAQVMAPGNAANFENVYVGGWLCEMPWKEALNGICAIAARGWIHNGDIGHAEILIRETYSEIGCSLVLDLWICDLA
jgi:hypothetical protein